MLGCVPSLFSFIAHAQSDIKVTAQSAKPVLDWDSELVANYRDMNQALPNTVRTEGLASLNASGSAQFNVTQWEWIKSRTPLNVFVVDLREESHAVFNQTKQIGWQVAFNAANRGMTLFEILQDEQQKIAAVRAHKKVQMYSWVEVTSGNWQMLPKVMWEITSAQSEAEIVGQANYLRVPVTDHDVPQASQVDVFLKLVANRSTNTWLHFHCLAGMGRTTTFLAMLDILSNASQLSLDEILNRQAALGGLDLLGGDDDASRGRQEFLRDFYQFALERKTHPKWLWSDWKTTH